MVPQLKNYSNDKGNSVMKTILVYGFGLILMALSVVQCTHHTIESRSEVEMKPVEIKPIHITIDVNVKVDRALDDFFGDLDKASTTAVEQEPTK